jgi:pantetheine-phosphate adenylyltransferase
VCLLTSLDHLFISSSLLKEVARLGGHVDDMLPGAVSRALQRKFGATK